MIELVTLLFDKLAGRLHEIPVRIRAWRAGRKSARGQVARRLQFLLNELNGCVHLGQWNVEKVAATIGQPNAEMLERCFDAQVNPDFHLLDRIATEFSINPEWLKFGHQAPFDLEDGTGLFAEAHFETIQKLDPKGIYFLRSDGPVGEACIVVELSDWNYRKLDYIWHISSHVGGTGASQIYSVAKLVDKLRASDFATRCWGRQVPASVFQQVMNGEKHPAFAALKVGLRSDWWDELDAAIEDSWNEQVYLERHGKEFVAAQLIVREEKSA